MIVQRCFISDALVNVLKETTESSFLTEFAFTVEQISISVYASLSSVAQNLVLKALLSSVKKDYFCFKLCCSADDLSDFYPNEVCEAFKELALLKIASFGHKNEIILERNFCFIITDHIFGFGKNLASITDSSSRIALQNDGFLFDYGASRWNSILRFVSQKCTKSTVSEPITKNILNILLFANLIGQTGEKAGYTVTAKGFCFLLMDTWSQVRFYLQNQLKYISKTESEEFLSFLTLLSIPCLHRVSNVPINMAYLKSVNSDHIRYLREIGLIYRKNSSSPHIYFTPFAIHSLLDKKPFVDDKRNETYIVVETNLRLYVFYPTDVLSCVLSLFCEVLIRFPNMHVCRLTRESVQTAFSLGITSLQLISFIKTYMRKFEVANWDILKSNVDLADVRVPDSVLDQVNLWESERNRFKYMHAVTLDNFTHLTEYENVLKIVTNEDPTVILFTCSTKKMIVLSDEGFEKVKEAINVQFVR